ncbi:hypothetical protein DVH05_006682 [Phytophthora capsici]|nr:hypothetical protein DVH05_006682 [Phytophthora capsici]
MKTKRSRRAEVRQSLRATAGVTAGSVFVVTEKIRYRNVMTPTTYPASPHFRHGGRNGVLNLLQLRLKTFQGLGISNKRVYPPSPPLLYISSRIGCSIHQSNNSINNRSRPSNFGVTKGKKRKDSNALSTITENWNLADDQFRSPFSEFDAQEQPIREELQRGLAIINDHTLKEIEDAITAAMSEVWGY